MVRVIVKYMLWIRDKIGIDKEEYVLKDGSVLKDLFETLSRKYIDLAKYFEKPLDKENPLIILVNNKKQDYGYVFRDGDEVIIMPPVSGG